MTKKTVTKFIDQYHDLGKAGLVDAYAVAPNGNPPVTWWAPNIAKQADRGVQTDFCFVFSSLTEKIRQSGPLDTGERRDHALIELVIDL